MNYKIIISLSMTIAMLVIMLSISVFAQDDRNIYMELGKIQNEQQNSQSNQKRMYSEISRISSLAIENATRLTRLETKMDSLMWWLSAIGIAVISQLSIVAYDRVKMRKNNKGNK